MRKNVKAINIKIDLIPPSDNNLYGQTGHIRFMYKEGKEWKQYAMLSAKQQYKGKLLKGRLIATMTFCFKRDRDLHGSLKLPFDFLEGICYDNDKQIFEEHFYKKVKCKEPHILIEIKKLT